LLLLNALANEALPIFLTGLHVPEVLSVLLACTLVLICGEILPSAVFTGPNQMTYAARFVPCVRLLLCGLYIIAKPIALALHYIVPHEDEEGETYSRPQLRAILKMHSQPAPSEAGSRESHPTGSSGHNGDEHDDTAPPFDALESHLCFRILDSGDEQVCDCAAFLSCRRCILDFHPAAADDNAWTAAGAAAAAKAGAVVVFESLDGVKWPLVFEPEHLLGILRLPEILVAAPKTTLRDLCKPLARVNRLHGGSWPSVAEALNSVAEACDSPCGFAMMLDETGGLPEFVGLLDGSQVLQGMLRCNSSNSAASTGVGALSDEKAAGVAAALTARASNDRGAAATCSSSSSSPAAPMAATDEPSAAAVDDPAGAHRLMRTNASTSTSDIDALIPLSGDLLPMDAAEVAQPAATEEALVDAEHSQGKADA